MTGAISSESADLRGPPSELTDALLLVQERFEANQLSDLAACQVALTCVISFLLRDETAAKRGAVRRLSALHHALNDRIKGAKPALLFATPTCGGAPAHQSEGARRAQFILALEVLFRSGVPKETAAHWLSDEMRKRNICDSKGGNVSERVLLRWRSELGAKSLSGSDAAFRILSRPLEKSGWPSTQTDGYRKAASLLDSLAMLNF